jgi:hypothetical protein
MGILECVMKYSSIGLVTLMLASCQPPSSPAPEVAVVAAAPQEEAPPRQIAPPVTIPPPKKEEPPPRPLAFPFPNDVAGKALPKVVAPPSPAPAPAEKFGKAPRPRVIPGKLIDPDPPAKVVHMPAPLLPAKSKGLTPTPPAERVPLDLGVGAAAVPARPVFAEAPGIVAKARDVKQPPDLAPLGRHLPDRAGLDDPTAEPANAIIAGRTPMPVLVVAGFLKVTIPDPFELAEQVKPKVLPAAEPSLAPVPANPQRVK